MNPFLDEKLILTISASFFEVLSGKLGIHAEREAYGVTQQEGLCYEYLAKVHFQGALEADFYIAMDSYTRLLLLPYVIKSFDLPVEKEQVTQTAMHTFTSTLVNELHDEVSEYISDMEIGDIETYHNKIVELPAEKFRKYTILYFLRDDTEKRYLGRIYLHLALVKK